MDKIQVIKKILDRFSEENVRYCYLRNYEFLMGSGETPEGNIVVDSRDMINVRKILRNSGFIERKQQFSLMHKSYFKLVGLEKISFDIQVGGVYWNDMQYCGKEILRNRVKKDFLYTPSNEDTVVMLIAHSILGKRKFKKKYQKIITELLLIVDRDYVIRKLSKIFTKKSAKGIMSKINQRDFSSIPFYNLILFFILKKPKQVGIITLLFLRWFKQKKNPLRLFPLVSIVGPDGAGKSTAVKELASFLEENNRKVKIVYSGRGRDNILPIRTIGRKYKSKERKKDSVKKSSKVPLKRKVLYTLMAPVYALDLHLRYLFYMLPARLKGKIVLTDRYGSDIILMKNVSFRLKKLLLSMFPKPSINILLYNDPEVLHARRPEEKVSELERQMKIFVTQKYSLKIETTNQEENINTVKTFVFTKLLRNWF